MTNQPISIRFAHLLDELRDGQRLERISSFTTSVDVPASVSLAFATDRPELLRLTAEKPLNAKEAGELYALIGELMQTNQALRDHINGVNEMIGVVDDIVSNYTLRTLALLPDILPKLLRFARFEDEKARDAAREHAQ